jgi:hypothetical protein
VTEAQSRDKHVGLADLTGLQLQPLDRIAGVINFYALTGLELSRGNRGLSVLRELAVKLFPEVGVGRQMLGLLLPDELQWVAPRIASRNFVTGCLISDVTSRLLVDEPRFGF